MTNSFTALRNFGSFCQLLNLFQNSVCFIFLDFMSKDKINLVYKIFGLVCIVTKKWHITRIGNNSYNENWKNICYFALFFGITKEGLAVRPKHKFYIKHYSSKNISTSSGVEYTLTSYCSLKDFSNSSGMVIDNVGILISPEKRIKSSYLNISDFIYSNLPETSYLYGELGNSSTGDDTASPSWTIDSHLMYSRGSALSFDGVDDFVIRLREVLNA